jgi:DnaD/phage-associated family protein
VKGFLSRKGGWKMAKFRMVRVDFWRNPVVSEEMSPEDKYFYLYLLTNPNTTQIGIYQITKKQMAFDLGYSIESVQALMERFIHHHKVIRYNPETRELAIKNWGKYNLQKGGKPIMDCIFSELKEVEDPSLIQYVSETIQKEEIRSVYQSFCKQVEMAISEEQGSDQEDQDMYLHTESEECNESFMPSLTLAGQKEKQQESHPVALNSDKENPFILSPEKEAVQEIIEIWDSNGFGLSNLNAKQQLLAWLDDSNFLQPKQVILKAMHIACANNKRKLSYIIGILKNWENESLLSVEEIDAFQENSKMVQNHKQSTESKPSDRDIPNRFVLDLTAGEDW